MSLIETKKLTAFYGDFQALFGVDLVLILAKQSPSSARTAPANRR